MWLSTAGKYLKLSWQMIKANILSAMEYRVSFLMQVIGMVVNDVGILLVWVIFFARFPEVNGWELRDTILLFSFMTINYPLVMVVAAGSRRIARAVLRGELDYYLSFPKNVLWHISVSKTDISAIGDLIFGFLLFIFLVHISLTQTLLFAGLVIISAWIIYSFIVIVQSLAFYVANFEDGAEQAFQSMLAFSFYPQNVFHGLLKLVMIAVVPAFFIITVPINLIRQFNFNSLLLLFGFALLAWILALTLFKRGLKRYESGNLINLNM